MSKLNIGWSEINITPEKKISLAGQFAERINSAWIDWKFQNAYEFPLIVTHDKIEIPFETESKPTAKK